MIPLSFVFLRCISVRIHLLHLLKINIFLNNSTYIFSSSFVRTSFVHGGITCCTREIVVVIIFLHENVVVVRTRSLGDLVHLLRAAVHFCAPFCIYATRRRRGRCLQSGPAVMTTMPAPEHHRTACPTVGVVGMGEQASPGGRRYSLSRQPMCTPPASARRDGSFLHNGRPTPDIPAGYEPPPWRLAGDMASMLMASARKEEVHGSAFSAGDDGLASALMSFKGCCVDDDLPRSRRGRKARGNVMSMCRVDVSMSISRSHLARHCCHHTCRRVTTAALRTGVVHGTL